MLTKSPHKLLGLSLIKILLEFLNHNHKNINGVCINYYKFNILQDSKVLNPLKEVYHKMI